jgi:hypothetical protein
MPLNTVLNRPEAGNRREDNSRGWGQGRELLFLVNN